ncbi:MAG: MFS transporter [Gammaproteobacteria bacterium]|nr:MFS transporter [Gammaproteobacteria bacterium]
MRHTEAGSDSRVAGAAQGWLLVAINCLPTLAIVSLVPNLPQLFQHFEHAPGKDLLVPMIITMPSLCIAIFGPLLAGPLADAWGRRRLLLVALAAFTVLGLAPLLFQGLYAVIASRAVVGIAEAAILTVQTTLLGDYFSGEERQKWLGYQAVVGSIAAAGIIVSGGMLGDLAWNGPFVLYLLAAPLFLWAWFVVWEPRRAPAVFGPGPATRGAAPPTAAAPAHFPWGSTLMVAAATLGTSLVYYVQALQLGRIFGELGVATPGRIGLIVMFASVGVVIGGYIYRRLSHLPVSRVFAVIFLAIGIGYVGLGLAADWRVGLPFAVIAQFGNGLAIPAMIAWALTKYSIENRGRGMGIWGGCFFVGQFLSPLAVSLVGLLTAGFMQTVVVVGSLCIAVAAVATTLRSEPLAAAGRH